MLSKNKGLFVTEDDDDDEQPQVVIPPDHMDVDSAESSSSELADSDNNEDDPVVQEIPLYINSNKNKPSENLYLFQYVSQLASKPINMNRGIHIGETRIKPVSQFVEIDIPLDVSRFYDTERGETFNNMSSESFGGHLVNNTNGLYFLSVLRDEPEVASNPDSKVGNDEVSETKIDAADRDTKETKTSVTSNFKLLATPVEKLAQIRPVFHHIDNFNLKVKQQEELDSKPMPGNADEKLKEAASKVQVVQMTAKLAGLENEIRYSDAIQTAKKAEEEEFIAATWVEQHENESRLLRKDLTDLSNFTYESNISQIDSKQQYLDDLLSDRFVTNFNV